MKGSCYKMRLFFEKKGKKFYQIPQGEKIPAGDTVLLSFKGSMLKVNASCLSKYEIHPRKAHRLLIKEGLKSRKSIRDFLKAGIRETAGRNGESEPKKAHLSLMSLLKHLYQAATGKELEKSKNAIRGIRTELSKAGIQTTDQFEQLPDKLREKYADESNQVSLKESVEAFRKQLRRFPLMK